MQTLLVLGSVGAATKGLFGDLGSSGSMEFGEGRRRCTPMWSTAATWTARASVNGVSCRREWSSLSVGVHWVIAVEESMSTLAKSSEVMMRRR